MAELSDADDPASWSVDRVIQELCRNQSVDWAGSGLSVPVPRATEAEQAFRENDIDGDVLLQLGISDFQAMNLTSIGQINKLSRLVLFLRSCSRIYSSQLERSFSANVIKTIEPTPSAYPEPYRLSLQPMNRIQNNMLARLGHTNSPSFHTASPIVAPYQTHSLGGPAANSLKRRIGQDLAEGPSSKDTILEVVDRSTDVQQERETSHTTRPSSFNFGESSSTAKRPHDTSEHAATKRRRILPTSVPSTFQSYARDREVFDVPFSHADTRVPAQSLDDITVEHQNIPEHASYELSRLLRESSDPYDSLLEQYPVEDDGNTLPLYGESDQEDREMTVESSTSEREDYETRQVDSASLKSEDLKMIVIDREMFFVGEWRTQKLELTQKRAHKKWKLAASSPRSRKTMLKAIQRDYDHVSTRLSHLQQAIIALQYAKVEDVKKQCESFQVSVYQREEYAFYIETLNSDKEPPIPKSILKPRPPKRNTNPEDIICESGDDDDSLYEFLSSKDSDGYGENQGILSNPGPSVAVDPSLDVNRTHGLVNTATYESEPSDEYSPSTPYDVTMADQVPPAQSPHTPRQYRLSDWPVADADDEEGDRAVSEYSQKSSARKRAAEGKARNPLIVPISTGSSDSEIKSRTRPKTSSSSKNRQPRLPVSEHEVVIVPSSPSSEGEEETRDENFEVRTPELNPNDSDSIPVKIEMSADMMSNTNPPYRQLIVPALAEAASVSWEDLSTDPEPNGFLALAKAILETNQKNAEALLQYSLSFTLKNFQNLLMDGIIFLRSDDDTDILDVPQNRQVTAVLLVVMFMTYVLVRKFNEAEELLEWEGHEAWDAITPSASVFRKGLIRLLRQHLSLALNGAASVSNSDHDSREVEEVIDRSKLLKRGKRKQKLFRQRKDSPAIDVPLDTQRMAKERVAAQEARKEFINNKLAQTASQTGRIEIPVNFKEPLVMLDQHIAQKIKPHQVNGVQFMWRELIEDTQQQGCLLAHTMGLGKTMQVISVLVTIAQCLKSPNPEIKRHIPTSLHDLRILILSPPALSENWYDELVFWMPQYDTLGPICKITNQSKQPYDEIKQWAESGGVLLIGYDRLVSYTKAPVKGQNESDQQYDRKVTRHEEMARWMFDLPRIVIADEAHMLKNPTAKRAETAMKMQTKSRIALTGSPLSNHLEEYWAMINFIAPGYLGDLSKFKQKFVEPINRCLNVDSGEFDRRLGLRKMHVLKKILGPKVNRADITAIQNDLSSKTEFFITVPLTTVQLEMYKICVGFFRNVSAESLGWKGKTASLLQWITVLSLLCNHPWTFQQKLNDPERQKKIRKLPSDDSEDFPEDDIGGAEQVGDDVDVAGVRTMLEAIKLALEAESIKTLPSMASLQDSVLSNRMELVKAIIKETLKLQEKILVFSHSLFTLDYMELVMKDLDCPFERIDGGLATDKRQQAAKDFNAGVSSAQAFLISTRAGGLGLNLYGATRVIILDYSFNPSWEEQAIGRAYRLGQQKPVFVYRFRSGGTFEDVTFNQAIFKTQLFTRIIDHKAVLRKGSKVEAGKYLVEPSIPQKKDFSECEGKDPEIMDKLMREFDCICDINLTETFAQDIDEGLTAKEIEEANQEIEDEKLARDDPHAYMMRLASRSAFKYQSQRTNSAAPHQTAEQIMATALQGNPLDFLPEGQYGFPSSAPPRQSGNQRQSWDDETVSHTTRL